MTAGFLLIAALAVAQSDDELLARAETAFHRGLDSSPTSAKAHELFRHAAENFELLRQRGYDNSSLYENEGKAWLLAGDLPRAILAFRRGFRLAPGDHRLSDGLAYARDQVVYGSAESYGRPAEASWPAWLPPLITRIEHPVAVLLLAGWACYTAAWLLVTRWWMTRRRAWLTSAILCLIAAALFATRWEIGQWQQRAFRDQPLVVIARDGATPRKGNGPRYPPIKDVPLNRGVEARRLFVRNDWLQIQLATGEVGWVPHADVLVDDS
jgi:hypothetical protein